MRRPIDEEGVMAADRIPEPGSKLGPCKISGSLSCGHIDCGQSREIANAACAICGRRIWYETDFYHDPVGHQYAHAPCLENVQGRWPMETDPGAE
jgi:hypothetical protein